MQQRMLTQRAFDLFYGTAGFIVLDHSLWARLKRHLPINVVILLLNRQGEISLPGETAEETADLKCAMGAPVGLKGFVATRKTSQLAQDWAAYIADQTGREPPQVTVVSRAKAENILAAILNHCVNDASSLRAAAGRNEADLAVLRQDYEHALITLEKARRIIRSAGFSSRYSTLTVPPGDKTFGPELAGRGDHSVVKIGLPVDVAGLVGLSLHCSLDSGDRAEGELTLSVYRTADRRLLGRATAPYAALDAGWQYFELEQPLARSFGDGVLVMEWATKTPGIVPQFSLSDSGSDRFGIEPQENQAGDQTALALALRMWTGFAIGDLSGRDTFAPPIERLHSSVAAQLGLAKTLDPKTTSASDLERDSMDAWVQTHAKPDRPVGLIFDHFVPAGACDIGVTVETAHDDGPVCTYLMVVADKGVSDLDKIKEIFEAVKAGQMSGVEDNTRLQWAAITLPSSIRRRLGMALQNNETGRTGPRNLTLAVVPTGGVARFGWSRWHDLDVGFNILEDFSAAHTASSGLQPSVQHMRSIKFREIGEQIQFLGGMSKLTKLTQELGFSPLLLAEEHGSLQTHPLQGEVSAGLYAHGAGSGTTYVACEIETAHERAPEFVYILVLVPSTADRPQALVETLIKDRIGVSKSTPAGYDAEHGIHYSSKRLKALNHERLEISLRQPLEGDHDIVFAAMPAEKSVAYGWCRWTSLTVANVYDAEPVTTLQAPSE